MRARRQPWASNPKIVAGLQELGAAEPSDLVALLWGSDDEAASRACWLLGQIGDRRYSRVLTKALTSDRVGLWMQSAVSLSVLESKRPTLPLIGLLCSPDRAADQRYAAGYALAFTSCALSDPRVRSAFREVAADFQAPAKVRGAVIEGLGNMSSGCFGPRGYEEATYDEIGQLLIGLLSDPEPEVRFWAAFALGGLSYRPALPELRRLKASDAAWFDGWWTVGEEASDAIDRIEGREPPERTARTREQALQREAESPSLPPASR